MIEVFSKSRIVKNWLHLIELELDKLIEFNYHSTLESLKNELDIKIGQTIAIIDLSDSNFQFYTKNYFGKSKNIKFIGIAIKIDLNQLKIVVESNIVSILQVGNSSLELIKAIKNVKNDKLYFCEETKEQIINEFIFSNKDARSFKNHELIEVEKNSKLLELNVLSLTEKAKTVTHLLIQGLSYKEIALTLGVTTFAINQNAKNIYRKLNVKSRSELSYRILNNNLN